MSQAAHQAIEAGVISRDSEGIYTSHRNVPRSGQNQTSQGHSNFSDGSGPLFNMYVKMAEEEDNKIADRWQKDADGILIFTGLFSATVAALVAVSIQDLRPNSQDTSAFYLENIFQLLANPNVSRSSILAIPTKPPPFSPPKYAIWVNSLWFLSLSISLTCALLATLLQQWARRYLTITQPPRYSPHKRARMCAFLADGVDKLHLPWAVETLPILLHVSLFLFFAGLLVFLFNIHHTVFSFVVWWVGLSVGIYGCITLMPIFRPDSPYYAPLSSSALKVYTGVSYGVFCMLSFITDFPCFNHATRHRIRNLVRSYRKRLWWGVVKTAQETASESSAEIDRRVLRRTFDVLDEDHELEQFFECIPGFCSSNVVDDPGGILTEMDLTDALIRFWDHTRTSGFVSETVRKKRLTICVKAAHSALSHAALQILKDIFWQGVDGVLGSVEMGHSLISLGINDNGDIAALAQAIVARIIASVPVGERDYRWIALVKDQLGISEDVLRDYLAHGNSVLLANLIHFTRQFFHSCLGRVGDMIFFAQYILLSNSEVDFQDTLPELQQDFCTLWNKIVLEARRNTVHHRIPFYILRNIRHIYIALHQGTDSAPTAFSTYTDDRDYILTQTSSYPLCNIPGHASHIDGPPEESAHASAATLSTVPRPDSVQSTISPSAAPDISPPPTPTPHHSRIRLADEPSLYDMPQATTTIESSHLTPPVKPEKNRFPATSLESAIAAGTQCPADTPTISPTASSEFVHHPTPAALTSIAQLLVTPPSSSTVAEQHNTDLGVVPHTIVSSMPFSTFSIPAPSPVNLLPADPHATPASPTSQIDQLTSGPGILLLRSVTAFSFTARQVTSVSHPSTAPNDGAFDTCDNSRAPDSSNNIEANIATELLRRSLDTVPSSHNTNRPG